MQRAAAGHDSRDRAGAMVPWVSARNLSVAIHRAISPGLGSLKCGEKPHVPLNTPLRCCAIYQLRELAWPAALVATVRSAKSRHCLVRGDWCRWGALGACERCGCATLGVLGRNSCAREVLQLNIRFRTRDGRLRRIQIAGGTVCRAGGARRGDGLARIAHLLDRRALAGSETQ